MPELARTSQELAGRFGKKLAKWIRPGQGWHPLSGRIANLSKVDLCETWPGQAGDQSTMDPISILTCAVLLAVDGDTVKCDGVNLRPMGAGGRSRTGPEKTRPLQAPQKR